MNKVSATSHGNAGIPRLLKQVLAIALLGASVFGLAGCRGNVDKKPVIYLYPEEETEVSVTLDFDGELTCTYPRSNGEWTVLARPDGTLTDSSGQSYGYLYWEGVSDVEYDLSEGFVIPGSETAKFLEWALDSLGLTRREANEFIVYWLPEMEHNAYNLISFQDETYTSHARLTVEPEPDVVLRVFMAWRPLDAPVSVAPQELTHTEREGFTVVEWGGAKLP